MVIPASYGISRLVFLRKLLNLDGKKYTLVGWGRKPSGMRAKIISDRLRLPHLFIEDGFLSFHATKKQSPSLAIVVDKVGIFYDSTLPSDLENLLAGSDEILSGFERTVQKSISLILKYSLSKYNHYPNLNTSLLQGSDKERILVIDQTVGDLSVTLGGANSASFNKMLRTAYTENPGATIYIKTHPEVASGYKRGYLTNIQDDDCTIVLRHPINPIQLISQMDRVYVVSSGMGFEALLCNKPVTCFGMPWYSSWGLTDDRCINSTARLRRTRHRSVEELFFAAYIYYTKYLNPITHTLGSVQDVIHWLIHQKEMAMRMHGDSRSNKVITVGCKKWKAFNLKPILGPDSNLVKFIGTPKKIISLNPISGDSIVYWGATPPIDLINYANKNSIKLLHAEDGFIRSVGLGSDLIPPLSIVLDQRGIYFDATRPSDLEHLLNEKLFSDQDIARAKSVCEFIIRHQITKYNIEPRKTIRWFSGNKAIILIPGQVEDDASITLGCTDVHTNIELLRRVRNEHPDAFIVYKPHPDVLSGNRKGHIQQEQVLQYADHIESDTSIISCIDACNELHTLTSLSGFDALIRGKKVVTYGQPFYAGWGLTIDRAMNTPAFERRKRILSLEELIAGALLHYPIYWDPILKGYSTCEGVLNRILEERTKLEQSGKLEKLHIGKFRRLFRKLKIICLSYTSEFKENLHF